jgi:type III pantothenate kinase
LVAIDIGNSRTKIGLFVDKRNASTGQTRLDQATLGDWLAAEVPPNTQLVVSSVNRPRLAQLRESLDVPRQGLLRELAYHDLPLQVDTRHPDKTGIDRLVAAVAALELKREDRAAIVVDLGTAITVDLVTADGRFAGGAIMPGMALAAGALAAGTDALPHIEFDSSGKAPDAVGVDTRSAIDAGLHWGAVGAIRELIERQADRLPIAPQVFVTGGASPQFARLLSSPHYTVRYVSHLVLAGIVISVRGSGR